MCRSLLCRVTLLALVSLLFSWPIRPAAAQEKPADKADDKTTSDEKTPAASPGRDKAEPAADEKEPEFLPGHSYHGEAFNEGPRQAAYLIEGTGPINFPVSTKDPLAQKFINQGVGQLHGFWYFEAERSFRQVAAIDPECAMAYWGMAMANTNNEKRAKGFIEEATKRKTGLTPRETMYIDALDAYLKAGTAKKKERSEAYARALEKIVYDNPNDLDAKAWLGLRLWSSRSDGLPISSYLAVDALLKEVLAVEPMHPCHHYRIHLWDYEKPERALDSAALCGQSAPAIAHMWHMPGHIYSRLKRYDDAAWQQEASARRDHAQMIRDHLMPDQIFNFAHNNEWLIRNLVYLGRAHDALDLAKNMTELPRHPKYNTLSGGSANYGRQRLFEVLSAFELWDELIALAETPYLEPTNVEAEQVKRLRFLGRAHFSKGDIEGGQKQLALLDEQLATIKKLQSEKSDEAKEKAKADKKDEKQIEKSGADAAKAFTSRIQAVEQAAAELKALEQVAQGKGAEGLAALKKIAGVDPFLLARAQLAAGEAAEAEKTLRGQLAKRKNEVLPLAHLAHVLWQQDKKKEAGDTFQQMREITGSLDLDTPAMKRLAPIAEERKLSGDWRIKQAPAADTGNRPDLDTLGPFRWRPTEAEPWTLPDHLNKDHRLADYRGRPVIVIFYLGYGCLHCAQQLQAFGPKTDAFMEAGISLVAISTDDLTGLKQSHKNYDKGDFPFPLVSDATLEVFKKYRAYDDFEKVPLHGTFLIDGAGFDRWHDIGYEPFMDADFLLGEAKRLLAQPVPSANPSATPRVSQTNAGQ